MALARRDFLRLSLAAAAAPFGVRLAAAQPKPEARSDNQLTAHLDGPQVWVLWNNRVLTSYRAHPTQKCPYLYPLTGPTSGLSLTTETCDAHRDHRSLFFACDRVNGSNYWQGPLSEGQIVSTALKLGRTSGTSVEILDRCEWRKPGQPVVMTDQRRFMIEVVNSGLWLIDAEIRWTAVQDVTIDKTDHSLFSLHAASDITPQGGGVLFTSEGRQGEKESFGKPAGWCTFYGRRRGIAGDLVEGIALFDHPDNFGKDCPWFTSDQGFISPSPFYFLKKPWHLAAGKSGQFNYRVVLFAGNPREASLQEIFEAWIED